MNYTASAVTPNYEINEKASKPEDPKTPAMFMFLAGHVCPSNHVP